MKYNCAQNCKPIDSDRSLTFDFLIFSIHTVSLYFLISAYFYFWSLLLLMVLLKWICSSQCHVTVFAGFVPICLHLLEGSTQSHMGRSVFLTTAWSSSECLKRWPSFNGVCFVIFLQTSAAGWTLDCLQEWGLFIKLAIPSMLMICLSWWIFEIGGFLAGVISEVELGAQSIAYQLCIVAYMVTFFHFSFPVFGETISSIHLFSIVFMKQWN